MPDVHARERLTKRQPVGGDCYFTGGGGRGGGGHAPKASAAVKTRLFNTCPSQKTLRPPLHIHAAFRFLTVHSHLSCPFRGLRESGNERQCPTGVLRRPHELNRDHIQNGSVLQTQPRGQTACTTQLGRTHTPSVHKEDGPRQGKAMDTWECGLRGPGAGAQLGSRSSAPLNRWAGAPASGSGAGKMPRRAEGCGALHRDPCWRVDPAGSQCSQKIKSTVGL